MPKTEIQKIAYYHGKRTAGTLTEAAPCRKWVRDQYGKNAHWFWKGYLANLGVAA